MTVFLCWSHSGKAYAEALGNFLRSCFPKGVAVKISTGLSKGGNWSDELLRQLKEANFGVMCLTPDSDSAWMCYEAGVLDSGGAPVAPLLFSVSRAFAPLSQKQVTAFAKDDVKKLTDDIYVSAKLNDWDTYEKRFEDAWQAFEEAVRRIEEKRIYRLKNFEEDLKALLDPENSGEYGEWASKRGSALALRLKSDSTPLLQKADELRDYMDDLKAYESKNRLFTSLRMKLERLVL